MTTVRRAVPGDLDEIVALAAEYCTADQLETVEEGVLMVRDFVRGRPFDDWAAASDQAARARATPGCPRGPGVARVPGPYERMSP